MILQSRSLSKSLATSVVTGVICTLVLVLSDTADARGNGGGGRSGFSRSSPASGGSLSSRPTVAERQQSGVTIQPRVTRRNNTGDAASPRPAQSASGVSSNIGAKSASGVKPTGGAGQPGTAGNSDPVSAQEMAAYRQQFNAQNKDNSRGGRNTDDGSDGDKDRDNWDAPLRPVDPDYSVPVRPLVPDNDDEPRHSAVVPAVVVGTVIASKNRADDYVDYVNTVEDPAYLTEMPCTIEAVMQLDDVTYYRCEKAWYKRGYQSGSVVYIQTDAPPGY